MLALSSGPAQAQAQVQPQAVQAEAAVKAQADYEVLAPLPGAALLQRFQALEPAARLHRLDQPTPEYTDGKERPALRLKRLWVGRQWSLAEIEGLPNPGRPQSAVIRFETFELQQDRATAVLEAVEGAELLQVRQGGRAIIIKPGDTVLAMFQGGIDDLYPMRLEHSTPGGMRTVYFEGIDPRFRERYDAAFKAATAQPLDPVAMKDFLVEFASNDPDNRARGVFAQLVGAMRAKNSFEGYYHAYLLLQDPADASKASKLAARPEHQAMMENLAVATLVTKSRLVDFDMQLTAGASQSGEGRCWMFCRYNFTATKPLLAQVQASVKPGAPIRLRHGSYRVNLLATVEMPRHRLRESGILGNEDRADTYRATHKLALVLAPPDYRASLQAALGNLTIAFMQRGSAGGYEGHWATGDPQVTLQLQSVELVQ